ncbi:hypothetical protein IAT38_003418 [Cryptococcus sp. DSM 104549]
MTLPLPLSPTLSHPYYHHQQQDYHQQLAIPQNDNLLPDERRCCCLAHPGGREPGQGVCGYITDLCLGLVLCQCCTCMRYRPEDAYRPGR